MPNYKTICSSRMPKGDLALHGFHAKMTDILAIKLIFKENQNQLILHPFGVMLCYNSARKNNVFC